MFRVAARSLSTIAERTGAGSRSSAPRVGTIASDVCSPLPSGRARFTHPITVENTFGAMAAMRAARAPAHDLAELARFAASETYAGLRARRLA